MRWLRRVIQVLAAGLLTLGGWPAPSGDAAPDAEPQPLPVPVRLLAAPTGLVYLDVGWLPVTGEVVVQVETAASVQFLQQPNTLTAVQPDGSGARSLPLLDEPECPITRRASPTALPDGRLAYLQECLGGKRQLPHPVREEGNVLLVFDPAAQTTEHLVDYSLPSFSTGVAFSPTQERGILGAGSF